MPFALAIIGIVFMVTAVKGSTGTLFGLIKDDFTGSGSYIYWVISILVIGSIGYIKKIQPVSDMFLALVLIVMFLANKGFFTTFMAAIKSGAGNCASTGTGGTDTTDLLTQQANAVPQTAAYQTGQSLEQQYGNAIQNLNSALGTSSTLGGG